LFLGGIRNVLVGQSEDSLAKAEGKGQKAETKAEGRNKGRRRNKGRTSKKE
jgi:hypothetical protein